LKTKAAFEDYFNINLPALKDPFSVSLRRYTLEKPPIDRSLHIL
jgi:hypothetical protein